MDSNTEENALPEEYLTPTELVAIRKAGKQQNQTSTTGEKFYHRNEERELDNISVETAQENRKDLLQKKVTSRICDLIQAEWKEELKACVSSKIKGKFVEHMGKNSKDQVFFSPEESIFLLENGSVEITSKGSTPMTREEAYAAILKGHLAIEKYQVYSHLSELGFIVVAHQTQFNVTEIEKGDNEHSKVSKKRKCPEEPTLKRDSKRLTFSGILSNSDQVHIETSPQQHSNTNTNVNFVEEDKNNASIADSPKNMDLNIADDVEEVKSNPSLVDDVGNFEEVAASVEDVIAKAISEGSKYEKNNVSSAVNGDVITENISPMHDVNIFTPTVNTVPEPFLISVSEPDSAAVVTLETSKNIDYMDVDSESTIESIALSEKSQEGIEPSSQQNSVEQSIEQPYAEEEKSSSEEDIDVENTSEEMSLSEEGGSSESEEEVIVEVSSLGENPEEEITVVDVQKKEVIPLAVIDLSGDEDSKKASESDSDDEIKVVNDDPGPSTSRGPVINESKTMVKCNIEDSKKKVTDKFKYTLKFPDYFRKDGICLCPPSIQFLPFNRVMSKEAYVINFKKQTNCRSESQQEPRRVWNSYHDLQAYQRNIRQNRRSFDRFQSRPWLYNQREPSFNSNSSWNHYRPPERSSLYNSHNSSIPPINTSFQNPHLNVRMEQSIFNSPNSIAETIAMAVRPTIFNPMSNPNDILTHVSQAVQAALQNQSRAALPQYESELNNSYLSRNLPQSYVDNFPAMTNNGHITSQQYNSFHNEIWENTRARPKYQCAFPSERKRGNWNDVRRESNVFQDLVFPKINNRHGSMSDFLWQNREICPLVRPGRKSNVNKLLQTLTITQRANLLDPCPSNNKYYPTNRQLEISFDVYLPGSKYKKTCPHVPNYRIIVVRSTDPIPRFSEIVYHQRHWNDSASLQIAVVDNGDITFHTFKIVNLPVSVPFESESLER